MTAHFSFSLQNINIFFEYVDFYAKIFLILYTPFEKSTPRIAIVLTIKEENRSKDWTPRLKLFIIALSSDEYSSDAIRFGMAWTPQFADKVDAQINNTDAQDKEFEFK